MRKLTFIVPVLLLFGVAASAQVYKWIDADGIVHYSDQPAPGAERIDLPSRPSTAVPAAQRQRTATAAPSAATGSRSATQVAAPFTYLSLSFSAPVAEETLWNIGGVLNVSISLQPALRSGDKLTLYFDGEAREIRTTSFQLEEVWRGEHNLQAEVVDADGKLMIRSEPMRFYVQQTSIAKP